MAWSHGIHKRKGLAKNKYQRTSGRVNAHLTPVIYFNAFIHVYSPRAGAENPLGTNVDVNRKTLSLCPFVASFKTISLKYDFKHILNDFIHVYSPGARAENPLGTNFWCSTENPYHFDHLLQVSNKSLFILILYTFFFFFPHVYSPWAGADNHLWTKSRCQQKSLVTLSICCKFQKSIFWSLILYIIFHVFIHVYSPWGQNFYININLLSLWSFAVSFFI